VTINGAQDTTDEDDETFSVNLSSPVNTTIGDGTGVGTITDNDAPPALSINDASRTEGSAVNGFTIGLSAASGKSVTVTYSTIDGTAKAPGDYTAKTATVTFTPGQTSKQVTINTVQDTLDENDETFTVKLTNPQNATISDSVGLGTILDNDPTPTLSIDDVSHAEGGQYVFTVTLSAASSKQVKVDYGTADGSATAPSDYATKSGTLTFAAGDTTKTISVSSVGDHAVEPDETFTVNLTNGVNAGISDPSGTGTLVNND
jgi:chitinase